MKVFVIEDEPIMAECLARAVRLAKLEETTVEIFHDALSAMSALSDELPDLILLDVLLKGPDGFTLLNELISYPDTALIPVILVTSLDFTNLELSHYGVVKILQKDTMTPAEIAHAVAQAVRQGSCSPKTRLHAHSSTQSRPDSRTCSDTEKSLAQLESSVHKQLEAF